MTQERVREKFEDYATTFHNSPMVGDCWSLDRQDDAYGAYVNIYVEQYWEVWQAAMEAGVRLGREDPDNISWSALRQQWKIEFGKELQCEGGRIMNIVDGVRELVRQEREQWAGLAESYECQCLPCKAIRAKAEKGGAI